MSSNGADERETPQSASSEQHAVVLFYKYLLPSEFPLLHQHAKYYEEQLAAFQKSLCQRLRLKGRVLLAVEGINGTLSGDSEQIQTYMDEMAQFELIGKCGLPQDANQSRETIRPEHLFRGVDWKKSISDISTKGSLVEPFPDLKISVVKEIISTGGSVSVEEIPRLGGTHLSPSEFHQAILENENVVLIDVRNEFEHNIGHFVNPQTREKAMNPETVTFSSFEGTFCERRAEELRDKKVLMYCTGGIRCEKASVMLKRRGVQDVSQLQGGIHRYLEQYGDDGLYQGRNFVFDQRVDQNHSSQPREIVGQCIECMGPYDEISGSRICAVCRDLVLVCPSCCSRLREYHCRRHQTWKTCYYTFIDMFDQKELEAQHQSLSTLRDSYTNKNMRRTLFRQMEKVRERIKQLEEGSASVDRKAPLRCRSCMETREVCNGLCWGFWKSQQVHPSAAEGATVEPLVPIQVGDCVEPGPHWNALRYGSTTTINDGGEARPRRGKVVEQKPWGAGATELDCVVIEWDDDARKKPQPYRWGFVGGNGCRLYDLQKVEL